MIVTVHQPNFLPYLGYFDKIKQSDIFVIMDDFQYTKRSYINRNRIKTPEGWMWLTVPVTLDGLPPINEVTIATQKFKKEHLTTLKHMYGKSDHFDEYYDWLKKVYDSEWTNLASINIHLIKEVLGFLDIDVELAYTSDMEINSKSTTGRIIDICQDVGASKYLSGKTGKDYLEVELFEQSSIDLDFHSFSPFPYTQQFGEFEPNLSVLDYLMNESGKPW